jgi:hypothetical protein
MKMGFASLAVALALSLVSSAAFAQYGYHLYFNGRLVSGADADGYTRQQARDNCLWNARTKPDIAISCTYNGRVFYQRD